jgi:hypothetical protein
MIAAGVIALFVLGAALHAADAKPYNAGQISKSGFVAGCKGVDGTVSTKGSVVKCSFPNGTSESCNFKNPKSGVICNYIPLTAGDADTHGPLGGGEADGGQGATITTGTHAGPIGGQIAVDDDTR